jgi:hypothetical protein
LNPYSYVLNNPLRYIDPTGHQAVQSILGGWVHQVLSEKPLGEEETLESGQIKVIITRDLIFGISVGSHSALWIKNQGDPFLYDPSGNYEESTRGSGGVFVGEEADLNRFLAFHKSEGSTVETFTFKITREEELQIINRVLPEDQSQGLGDPRGLNCARFVCKALTGIGPFKDLEVHIFPGNLADTLKKLKQKMP